MSDRLQVFDASDECACLMGRLLDCIRVGQAAQLLARIDQVKESQGIAFVIITGDFNADAVQYNGYEPLTYRAMTSHGYRSVYDEYYAGRNDWWTTWKIRIKNVRGTSMRPVVDAVDDFCGSTMH